MQRKYLAVLLALCMLLGAVPFAVSAGAADATHVHDFNDEGKCTDSSCTATATVINSADALVGLMGKTLTTNYVLVPADGTKTLDLSTVSGTQAPITKLSGTYVFDGNGVTVTGVNITSNKQNVGFFAEVRDGAVVRDLTVEGTMITSTHDGTANNPGRLGGIVGYTANQVTVQNCINECPLNAGTGAANLVIGGIVGNANTATQGCEVTVTDCVNKGNITGGTATIGAAGVIGWANIGAVKSFSVMNCKNTADITSGGNDVGGIIGVIKGSGNTTTTVTAVVSCCQNTGAIKGKAYVGGIVGDFGAVTKKDGTSVVGEISLCQNSGTVTATGNDVGGIVGLVASNTVKNCLSTGTVTYSASNVGGLIGRAKAGTTVSDCYSSATLSGSGTADAVCGIIANAATTSFTNCYSAADSSITSGVTNASFYSVAQLLIALNGGEKDGVWVYNSNESGVALDSNHECGDWTKGSSKHICPKCEYAEEHEWDPTSDKSQHICSVCENTSAHDFTSDTCACGITKLTLTALDMVDGVLVPTFSPSVGDADIQLTVANKTVNGTQLTVSGFSLTGADAEDYLLDASASYEITLTEADLTTVTINYVCGETEVQASATETVVKGLEYSVTAPSVEGYTFSKWQDNSTNATYTATVSGNVTLTAYYTENSSAGEGGNEEDETVQQSDIRKSLVLVLGLISRNNRQCVVTYKSTGANTHVYETVKKGTVLQMPEAPTKEGYTFVGWYKDINGVKPFDFNTKITGNVSIYAKWVKN